MHGDKHSPRVVKMLAKMAARCENPNSIIIWKEGEEGEGDGGEFGNVRSRQTVYIVN